MRDQYMRNVQREMGFMHPMDAMFTYILMASTGESTIYPSEEVSTPTLVTTAVPRKTGI